LTVAMKSSSHCTDIPDVIQPLSIYANLAPRRAKIFRGFWTIDREQCHPRWTGGV
jgi:hypothetical protein